MQAQDWDPVILRRRTNASPVAGVPRLSAAAAHAAKVDREELPRLRTLSPNTRRAIVAARMQAGLTQAQLNVRAGLPLNSVNHYEAGRGVPSPTQLQQLSHALGVSLHYAKS